MMPRLAEIDVPLEKYFAYYNRLFLCALSFVCRPFSDVETDWQSSVIRILLSSNISRSSVTKKYRIMAAR